MNLLLRLFCIWFTKITIFFCRLVGHNGTNLAGKIVVRIYPKILTDLSRQVREKIIVVCGTNGKTTTNNLIDKLLTDKGNKVVCNRLGANMTEGVIVAFIRETNWLGKLDADYASLEIDEGYAQRLFRYFEPDLLIINNLFRDQLDRYGEIDLTMEMLNRALEQLSHTTLLLNADDPLCAQFAKRFSLQAVFYGITQDLGISCNETKEGRFCPFCGKELDYEYYHYSQLGNYRCPQCSFQRPEPDFTADHISFDKGLSFCVNGQAITLNYRGLYNIYNVLAAYAVISLCGLSTQDVGEILATYRPQIGRMEEFSFPQKKVVLNLSKNPAGFNQGISTVQLDGSRKDVIIAINDNIQDGKDVSWLWDVDFEKLQNNIRHITTCGIRRHDMLIRLKYADFQNISTLSSMKEAVLDALESDSEIVYVLVNYSALFPTHAVLSGLLEEVGKGGGQG
ncbi:MAG: MurT ligase domain-containing protein [Clostridia bacterium]|nr:MurT ligase domain-containing protein [Clostridia bacterium]